MRLSLWRDETAWMIVVLQRCNAEGFETQGAEQVKVYQTFGALGLQRYTYWDEDGYEVDLPGGVYDVLTQKNRQRELPGGLSDTPSQSDGQAVYCVVCEKWLNGPTQMDDHKIGKKHKKHSKGRTASQPSLHRCLVVAP